MKRLLEIIKALIEIWKENSYHKKKLRIMNKRIGEIGFYEHWKEGEAHHYDYSKPLEVVWLCKRHHADIHLKTIIHPLTQ